jgi:hypothetical protein
MRSGGGRCKLLRQEIFRCQEILGFEVERRRGHADRAVQGDRAAIENERTTPRKRDRIARCLRDAAIAV